MPRITFLQDYVATPHPAQSVKYRGGETYLVTQAVAAEVIARGRGHIAGQKREEPPAEPLDEPPRLKGIGDAVR